MTSKLTREQLHERARENVKALKMASRQTAFESAREEILADLQLAELALAAMDSEPDCKERKLFCSTDTARMRKAITVSAGTDVAQPYRHAQPAPVVNGEYGDAYQGAREDLAIWKRRALEAEESVRRLEQINDHLVKEAQGESRMGEPVIAQPVPVVPDEIKHRIGGLDWGWEGEFNRGWNACRAAMLNGGKS